MPGVDGTFQGARRNRERETHTHKHTFWPTISPAELGATSHGG